MVTLLLTAVFCVLGVPTLCYVCAAVNSGHGRKFALINSHFFSLTAAVKRIQVRLSLGSTFIQMSVALDWSFLFYKNGSIKKVEF